MWPTTDTVRLSLDNGLKCLLLLRPLLSTCGLLRGFRSQSMTVSKKSVHVFQALNDHNHMKSSSHKSVQKRQMGH